jgi:hypothetical protein
MFRVGVRSQLITLVCMILLFVLSAQWLWDQRHRFGGTLKVAALLSAVVALSAIDLARSGPVVGQYNVFPVSPRAALAAELATKPPGMTLTLPAYDDHFDSESYYLSIVHGMPVLNSNLGRLGPDAAKAIFTTANKLNAASKERLESCGVRYLIVADLGSTVAQWSQVAGIYLIAQNSQGAVYELPNARAWPVNLSEVRRADRDRAIVELHQFLSSCAEPLVMSAVGGDAKK